MSDIEITDKVFNLDTLQNILYAGDMEITSKFAVCTTCTSTVLPYMKTGVYHLYISKNILIAVNESYTNAIENLKNITFMHSGKIMGTFDNMFGFCDKNVFMQIPDQMIDLLYQKNFKHKINDTVFYNLNMSALLDLDYSIDPYLIDTTTEEYVKNYPKNIGIVFKPELCNKKIAECYVYGSEIAILKTCNN